MGTLLRTVHENVGVLPLNFKLRFQMTYIKQKRGRGKIFISQIYLTSVKSLNVVTVFS